MRQFEIVAQVEGIVGHVRHAQIAMVVTPEEKLEWDSLSKAQQDVWLCENGSVKITDTSISDSGNIADVEINEIIPTALSNIKEDLSLILEYVLGDKDLEANTKEAALRLEGIIPDEDINHELIEAEGLLKRAVMLLDSIHGYDNKVYTDIQEFLER